MQSIAKTPDQYYKDLPDERKPAMEKLRVILKTSLPNGFEETMAYGMPGFVVPHSLILLLNFYNGFRMSMQYLS